LSWIWEEDTGHKKLEKGAMGRRGWRGYVQVKARNGGLLHYRRRRRWRWWWWWRRRRI